MFFVYIMYLKTLLINICILIVSVGSLLFLYRSTYGTLLTGSLNDVITGKQSFISFGSRDDSAATWAIIASTNPSDEQSSVDNTLYDDSSYVDLDQEDGSYEQSGEEEMQVIMLDENGLPDETLWTENIPQEEYIDESTIIDTVIAQDTAQLIADETNSETWAEKFDRWTTDPVIDNTQSDVTTITEQPANPQPSQAQAATWPSITCNGYTASLLLATSPKERRTWLMFRESIDENEWMFFTFDSSDAHGIWMKNMEFPIDIIWLDENHSIVDIQTAPVCASWQDTCPVYEPTWNAKYVLEVNAWISEAYGFYPWDSCTKQG